jgi:glycosyltransferase involved in cell wall biosynthesis
MTAGLERLLTDEPLRRELCARGRARAAAFTWDRTAVTAADVFQKVAEGAI